MAMSVALSFGSLLLLGSLLVGLSLGVNSGNQLGSSGCSGYFALGYEIWQINFDYANSDGLMPEFVVMPVESLGHEDYQIVGVQSAGMFPANMNDYGGMHQGSGLASGYGDVRGLHGAGFEQQCPYGGRTTNWGQHIGHEQGAKYDWPSESRRVKDKKRGRAAAHGEKIEQLDYEDGPGEWA